MENNFQNINDLIAYSKDGILSKEIIKNDKGGSEAEALLPPKLNVTLFSMAQGTEISEHTSTKQGFVYIVEGKGIFNLAGKNIEMSPGVFIQMQENMVHSLKAEENTSFLLALVV